MNRGIFFDIAAGSFISDLYEAYARFFELLADMK